MRAGRPNASSNSSVTKRRESKSSNHATPWEARTEDAAEDALHFSSQQDRFKQSLGDDGFGIQMGESSEAEVMGVSQGRTAADEVSRMTAMSIPNGAKSEYLNTPDFLNSATLPGTEDGLAAVVNPGFSLDLEEFVHDYNWSLQQTQFLGTQHSSGSSMIEVSQGVKPGGSSNSKPFAVTTSGIVPTGEPCRVPSGSTNPANKVKGMGTKTLTPSLLSTGDTMEWEGGLNGPKLINQAPTFFNDEDGNSSFPVVLSPSSPHDVQHRRTQELSELAMTLYSQVVETTSRDGAATSAHSVLHDLTGKVLKSSVKFLGLLTSSYVNNGSQSSDLPYQPSSSDDDMSSTEASEFQLSPAGEPTLRSPLWENSSSSTVCNNNDEVKPQQVEMTEVFALLTCYIRILHLHSLLYSQFSEFLVSLSERGVHMPPLIPGMQIGGVSLDNFGKFQIKFLLQVSTHVLGEIEMALGLPDGHRISKKDRQSQGILEGSVSTQFIEMTMGERGKTGVAMEKDEVGSIRNHIATLRQLLKGTINP